MALIKCPECGKENISDTAETCPICGYGINKYFEKLKIIEAEEKKQLEKEKDIQLMNEKKQEILIKTKEQKERIHNKLFGSIKKKLCCMLLVLIFICSTISYFYNTREIREIKKATIECEEYINRRVEEDLYKYIDLGNDKKYMKLDWITLSLADGYVGGVRELYEKLNESDKEKYLIYLKNTNDITWEELNKKWELYGLTKTKRYEWKKDEEEYYKEIIQKLYKDNEQKKLDKYGSVSVIEKKYSTTSDSYCIEGSVKNTTKNTVYFVKIKVSLLNSKNEVINTENTYAVGDEGLKSGESTKFTCYISKVEGVKSYRAEVYEYD